MKTLFFCLLVLIGSATYSVTEEDLKLFNQSNTAYDNADYKTAISGYQALSTNNPNSGELFYNLANSYFKNNELGKAIYYYLKAQEILPRHGDIKYNLEYAKNQKMDKQEGNKNIFSIIDIPLNKDELVTLTALVSLFFWILMIISLYKKNFIIISIRYFTIFAFLSCGILLAIEHFEQKTVGVIITNETSVFSTTGVNSTKLFTLHEGSEVVVLDKKDSWILITLGDNKKGWVPSDNLIF